MRGNETGTPVVDGAMELHCNLGPDWMRDGIAGAVNGRLGSDPPRLGASVREGSIEPGA